MENEQQLIEFVEAVYRQTYLRREFGRVFNSLDLFCENLDADDEQSVLNNVRLYLENLAAELDVAEQTAAALLPWAVAYREELHDLSRAVSAQDAAAADTLMPEAPPSEAVSLGDTMPEGAPPSEAVSLGDTMPEGAPPEDMLPEPSEELSAEAVSAEGAPPEDMLSEAALSEEGGEISTKSDSAAYAGEVTGYLSWQGEDAEPEEDEDSDYEDDVLPYASSNPAPRPSTPDDCLVREEDLFFLVDSNNEKVEAPSLSKVTLQGMKYEADFYGQEEDAPDDDPIPGDTAQ